jgi:hypothetical protein
MRAARVVTCVVVASLCLLAGCQRPRTTATTRAEPQPLNEAGPYRHPASGMEFPTKIDEFNRVALAQYDDAGRIVSARYEIDGATSKITATVFVYPIYGSAGTRAERTHTGRHAVFLYDEPIENDTRAATAQLYVFCDASGPWQLEYRFTHPRELVVAPIIADFLNRLTWTLYPE